MPRCRLRGKGRLSIGGRHKKGRSLRISMTLSEEDVHFTGFFLQKSDSHGSKSAPPSSIAANQSSDASLSTAVPVHLYKVNQPETDQNGAERAHVVLKTEPELVDVTNNVQENETNGLSTNLYQSPLATATGGSQCLLENKIDEFVNREIPETGQVCSGCMPLFNQRLEQMASTQAAILKELVLIKEELKQKIVLDPCTGNKEVLDLSINTPMSTPNGQRVDASTSVAPVERLMPLQVGVGTRREPMDIGSLRDTCSYDNYCCTIPASAIISVHEKADANMCNFATTMFMALYLPEELQGRAVDGNKDGKPPLSPRRKEAIKKKTMEVYNVPASEMPVKWKECKNSVNKKLLRVFGKQPSILPTCMDM